MHLVIRNIIEIYVLFLEINYCAGSPCINGGTCNNDPDRQRYTCACVDGYRGDRCAESEYILSSIGVAAFSY